MLADVTSDMDIAQEEIFGPIVCIMKVKGDSDAEAVRIANHCGFALGASVHSANVERARRVGGAVRAGMCAVNDLEGARYA